MLQKLENVFLFLRERLCGLKRKYELLNCWFCNEHCAIKLTEADLGWVCPHCEQYNGFQEDGDYNCFIPEQYEISTKTDKVFCKKETFKAVNSILCYSCNQNQVLKVRQLAAFVPLSDPFFDEEVEDYKDYLESVYRLCQRCKDKVNIYLDRQDKEILKQLDQENIQIKEQVSTKALPASTLFMSINPPSRLWNQMMLFLCFLMGFVNLLLCTKLNLELHKDRLRGPLTFLYPYIVLVTRYIIPFSVDQLTLQLTVYCGALFCVLGLFAIGKTCIYVKDAFHISCWLLLLVSHGLTQLCCSTCWFFLTFGISSPLHFFSSLATSLVSLSCLVKTRYPKNVFLPNCQRSCKQAHQQHNSNEKIISMKENVSTKKSLDSSNDIQNSPSLNASSSIMSSSTSLSPTLTPLQVGQAHNFFKPIPGSSICSPLFSSISQRNPAYSADETKNDFDLVRRNLEVFSFGSERNSAGSTSNIWTVPNIVPLGNSTITSDTSPTTSNQQQSDTRNIISPSRLSFLSFSLTSPGNFSPSSPSTEADSGISPDNWHDHQSKKINSSFAANDFQKEDNEKEIESASHSSSFHIIQQKCRKETSYKTLSRQCSNKIPSSKANKVIAIPDSSTPTHSSIKDTQSGPRRSNRIALRGKIIKPWPLKKSFSVNDMYDKSDNCGVTRRPAGRIQTFSGKGADSGIEVSGFQRYQSPKTIGETYHSFKLSPIKRSLLGESRGGFLSDMDCPSDFSDDENLDRTMMQRELKILRGKTSKVADSHWVWTVFGLIIGISLTINALFVWRVMMQKTSIITD